MEHARDIFCSNMTNNDPPIKFEVGKNVEKAGTYAAPDNPDNPVYVAANWKAADGQDCPTMNFEDNEDAYYLCQDRLDVAIQNCKRRLTTMLGCRD